MQAKAWDTFKINKSSLAKESILSVLLLNEKVSSILNINLCNFKALIYNNKHSSIDSEYSHQVCYSPHNSQTSDWVIKESNNPI